MWSVNMLCIFALVAATLAAGAAAGPVLETVSPDAWMETTAVEIRLDGTYFANATSVTIGGVDCALDHASLVTEPCLLWYSRQETCDLSYNSTELDQAGVEELLPCDFNPNCVLARNPTIYCGSETLPTCVLHRCYAVAPVDQCFGFDDAPDHAYCGFEQACMGGQCVNARGNECPSTITCAFPRDNGLLPGLYNVTFSTDEGSSTIVGGFRVLPQPIAALVETPVFVEYISLPGAPPYDYYDYATLEVAAMDAVVTAGTVLYAQALALSSGLPQPVNLSFSVDGIQFGLLEPFPVLDTGGLPSKDVDVVLMAAFPDYGTEPVPCALNWSITYTQRPLVYSLCPSAVLAFVDNIVVVQGDNFVDSRWFRCTVDDEPVPHVFLNDRTIHCTVRADDNITGQSHEVTVTNDRYVLPPGAGTITVTGACSQLKPNSVPVGDECLCSAGFADTGQACIPCADGSYQPGVGQGACIPCDSTENTGGLAGSTSVAACRCRDGLIASAEGGCEPCQAGMLCVAGQVTVEAGYWRPSNDSRFVLECPTGGAGCAGGMGSGDGVCKKGYEGPLCSVCSEGYGNVGSFCMPCGDRGLSVFIMFVIFIVAVLVCIVLIKSTTGSGIDSVELSTVVKIMLNYLQALYYIAFLSAEWGELTESFFAGTSVASFSPSFLSVQCATRMDFYDRIGLTMAMPLLTAVLCAVPYSVLQIAFLRRAPELRGMYVPPSAQYASAMVIVLYILHPPIALEVLGSLRCERVPGVGNFLRDDMSVSCDTGSYQVYRVLAIFYTAVYIIGGVAFVTWRIWVNRESLSGDRGVYNRDNSRYLYLSRGYKHNTIMWEGAVLARKLGVVMCSAFLSSELQLLWGLIIIGSSLIITIFKKPYEVRRESNVNANSLDIWALAALTVTVIAGFHTRVEGSDGLSIFLLVVIMNGGVMLLLLASAFKKVKTLLNAFYTAMSRRFMWNEQKTFDSVQMRRRSSRGSVAIDAQMTFEP